MHKTLTGSQELSLNLTVTSPETSVEGGMAVSFGFEPDEGLEGRSGRGVKVPPTPEPAHRGRLHPRGLHPSSDALAQDTPIKQFASP